MKITYDIDEDIVKEVHIDCTPTEYLVLNSALRLAQTDENWVKADRVLIGYMSDCMANAFNDRGKSGDCMRSIKGNEDGTNR